MKNQSDFDAVSPAALAAARSQLAQAGGRAGRGACKRRAPEHYARISKLAGVSHHRRALVRKRNRKAAENKAK
jgi:hypothetical protein